GFGWAELSDQRCEPLEVAGVVPSIVSVGVKVSQPTGNSCRGKHGVEHLVACGGSKPREGLGHKRRDLRRGDGIRAVNGHRVKTQLRPKCLLVANDRLKGGIEVDGLIGPDLLSTDEEPD